MAPVRLLRSIQGAAFCALFVLLSTGCTKEEVLAPADVTGTVKCGDAGSSTDNVGGTGTRGISDDGDDQGDNEKGRKKGR